MIVDRQIDRSVTLAETHTDLAGRYEVQFSARGLAECQKAKPDLQAHVYAENAAGDVGHALQRHDA